tara:strand:+ start:425 stop:643 length:219 start_codon:yes stop_codon:yes gene_type:complete
MYETIESFIKHHGWTKTARIDYLVKYLSEGKSKDEIKKVAVDEYGIFPNDRQFSTTWNYVEKIRDSIQWVSK